MASDCVFCDRITNGEYDHFDDNAVTFEPLNPVIPGRHFLVVPRRHAQSAKDDPRGAADAMQLAAELAGEMGMDFNIITSSGPDATQTVPHTHLHVLLRKAGDGLVLPWTGQRLLTELAEAQQSAKFWQGQAEQWEREHQNTVLPYTTELEAQVAALQAEVDQSDQLYVQACGANTATTEQLNAAQAHIDAVLAVCDRHDRGLFPLAQIRAAALGTKSTEPPAPFTAADQAFPEEKP